VLFACVYVPNFLTQAALRHDRDTREKPFVVVSGTPPQVRVIALNAKAQKMGLWIGMTRSDAEAVTGIQVRERSIGFEMAAHAALLDCMTRFSPWCEDIADDMLVLDISGQSKLLGTPTQIARSIRDQARSLSIYIKVGVAGNIDSAIHAARVGQGICILPAGREAELLKDTPLEILDPSPEIAETLRRWGIRTFGQLAALPDFDLSQRLGQEGLRLQALAQGLSSRMLSPTSPPAVFDEVMQFDDSVEDLKSLAFIFNRLLDQLVFRLTSRSLAVGELRLELQLNLAADGAQATEKIFTRTLKLPVPTVDIKLLLKLLQLDLEAHQPGAPVDGVMIHAEAARPRVVQEGMFVPKGPEPQRLELTLARLRKIVGEGRVGAAELIDQHLQVPFRMVHFSPRATSKSGSVSAVQRTAVRIFRPSVPVRVVKTNGAPRWVRFQGLEHRVIQASGPWRRSGEWWTQDHWGRDEWDMILDGGGESRLLVRSYRDLVTGQWYVEAEYD
jgi:protein ImuB